MVGCIHRSLCFAVIMVFGSLKASLHRRFLSRQLDAIFVAPKLQLQNRTCKPSAIFNAICRRDISGVSNMFETCCNLSATKIASSCCDKNRLCKRAFKTTSAAARTSSENVTSCSCNLFQIIQSRYVRKMCSKYPGIILETALSFRIQN